MTVETAVETAPVGIADAHLHLQDPRFGADLTPVLDAARRRGVERFVCAGTSPADWNRTAAICRQYPGVYPAFGIHPWQVGRSSGDWRGVLRMSIDETVAFDGSTGAALGEVGLDFAVRERNDAAQEGALRAQLEIANERAIPAILHSVRANERLLGIMSEYRKIPVWLLHGWTATKAEIDRAVDLNAFFSFSKRQVAPDAERGRATVAAVPRDRILLESDSPTQLAPAPRDPATRAKILPAFAFEARDGSGVLLDGPASIVDVAAEIRAIRKTPADEFFRQLAVNERRFFQSWPRRK